jgi:hypothetical protein
MLAIWEILYLSRTCGTACSIETLHIFTAIMAGNYETIILKYIGSPGMEGRRPGVSQFAGDW